MNSVSLPPATRPPGTAVSAVDPLQHSELGNTARPRAMRLLHAILIAVVAAVVASACGSSSSTSTGPSPTKCQVTLAVAPASLGASGGGGNVTVTAPPECAWTASTQANWLTQLSPTAGQGNGSFTFQVPANPGSTARQGEITVNDNRVSVNQEGSACGFTIAPTSRGDGPDGGSSSVAVSASANCAWTATSAVPWIAITAGASGTGNGTVAFTVAANTGPARTGTLTIAGQTFTVTQAAVGCVYAINPTTQSIGAAGGPGSTIAVTTTSVCGWTATSGVPWITITSGASGTGNGNVAFSVAANTGAARTGTLTIAGQTFTVTQAAAATPCVYAISATSQSVGAAGGAGTPVTVTTAGGCTWTASSSVPWITITSGASGSGNGTVGFTVAANTGAARTGTLTIAGQTFTVTQAAVPCTYAISPATVAVGAAGGAATPVGVTSGAGCVWTARSDVPWLTITSGASGTGTGTVGFSAAANTGPARSGTLTIAGQTVTVTQATGCTYAINPTTQSFAAAGGAGTPVAVTTTSSCTWNATSGAPWITVTSGAGGSGNGSVGFSVAANVGPARTGTLTIAGQTFTVSQVSGCVFTVNPAAQSVGPAPGVAPPFSVTTSAGACQWTASSDVPWITVTAGGSGTGPGTVTFRVDVNIFGVRTGRVTVGGQASHTVTQLSGLAGLEP